MSQPPPPTPAEPEDFSLVLGGPLYQLYLRSRLVRPPLEFLHRRIVAITGIAWLPLLALSVIGGTAWSGANVPYFYDIDAHARFLVALPLLVAAELLVHRLIAEIVRQFNERGLIATADREAFERAIAAARRVRNSLPMEVVLLVVAFVAGHFLWESRVALHVSTWYGSQSEAGRQLTAAGMWFAYVSLPIFRFLLLRWYFRLAIWYGFLWRVSRINLRLNALHPDRTGGVSFLGRSAFAFAPVLVAHTVHLAGLIAERIWHEGATLPTFKLEIAGFIVYLLLLVLAPLLFFVTQLERTKRAGLREYGGRASCYVNEFRQKWLASRGSSNEEFLGSSDIQSLADLGNSYEVVRQMRLVPIERKEILQLAILVALPLLPLILTMVPLEEMLDRLMKLIL